MVTRLKIVALISVWMDSKKKRTPSVMPTARLILISPCIPTVKRMEKRKTKID